jgi:hypothetical protein
MYGTSDYVVLRCLSIRHDTRWREVALKCQFTGRATFYHVKDNQVLMILLLFNGIPAKFLHGLTAV